MNNALRPALLAKRALIVGAAGAALVVAFQQSVGFGLGNAVPQMALAVAPNHSAALGALVQVMGAQSNARQNLPAINRAAIRAAARAPIFKSSWRKVAVTYGLQRQGPQASRMFNLVARNSLREDLAHAWVLGEAFSARNYAQVAREADIILRHGDPSLRNNALRMTNLLVEEGSAIPSLVDRLAINPAWRRQYLYYMALNSTSIANERRLLYGLRRSANPPTSEELDAWFANRAAKVSQRELLADYQALSPHRFLPAEHYLRDGNFEGTRAVGPFKWKYLNNEHALGSVGPAEGIRGKALFLDFSGRIAATAAEQMLTAAPGRYRITWRANAVSAAAGSALTMRITCTLADDSVTTSDVDLPVSINRWTAGSGNFSVPGNCVRTMVSLMYAPAGLSNQPMQVYVDDIVIAPAGAADDAQVATTAPDRTPGPASGER